MGELGNVWGLAERGSEGKTGPEGKEGIIKISAPSALAEYPSGEEITESKAAFITLLVTLKAEAKEGKVKLINNGKEMSFVWDATIISTQRLPIPFVVNKAAKWKAIFEGSVEKLEISRVILE